MNHREIEVQLADYADGRLSPGEHALIEEHARGCDTCSAWLETYALLSEHREALHPDSEDLAARAAGEPVPDEVIEHLESCASCWQLVAESSRALEKAGFLDKHRPAPLRSAPIRRAPYWIAAAALLLLSLTFLLPRSDAPDDQGASPWAGPAPVLVLSAVTRQAESDEILTLRDDQAYVAVGLDLGARLARLTGKVEIELSRGPGETGTGEIGPGEIGPGEIGPGEIGAGEIVWRGAWSPDELVDIAVDGGLLMLYWPRELLEPAVYEIRVRDTSAEEPWRRRFVVRHRADEEATVERGR